MVHNTVRIDFTCCPKDILYLNSVFDSYDGLGLMRTLEKSHYNCAIFSTEGVYETALQVLNVLKSEGVGISEIRVSRTESVEI